MQSTTPVTFDPRPARRTLVLVTGYLLVFGISVPFYGRLADRLGARRLFVAGLCIFAIGSLLCAVASTLPTSKTRRRTVSTSIAQSTAYGSRR